MLVCVCVRAMLVHICVCAELHISVCKNVCHGCWRDHMAEQFILSHKGRLAKSFRWPEICDLSERFNLRLGFVL